MRKLLALALILALAQPADARSRLWGWFYRNVDSTTTSTSSTSTSSTSTSSSSSTSTSGTASTTSSSTTSSTSTTSTTLDGVAANDYSSACVAWWNCEEADNATLLANDLTTCGAAGTDCDLSNVGTVTRDTVNFVEGSKSCSYNAATDRNECTDAVCGTPSGTELDCAGDCTFGGWIRPTIDGTQRILKKNTSTPGYMLFRESTNDNFSCMIGDGSTSSVDMAANSAPVDTWTHAVCRVIDATDSQQGFANGAASGGSATQSGVAASTSTVTISDATLPFDGQADAMFVCNVALSTPEICKFCSCGVDGRFCLCDVADDNNYKACTVDADCQTLSTQGRCDTTSGTCQGLNHATNPGCGGCTLPSCLSP